MRGQLKAQQHALLGLQEQLQGTSYPALEAAAAASGVPRSGQLPALDQPNPGSSFISNGPANSDQPSVISDHDDNIHIPNPADSHKGPLQMDTSEAERAGTIDAPVSLGANTKSEQRAPTRSQKGTGSEPMRGAAILRKSHEGLAALVSQIGQHVSDVEPENEARKRPRRTISAEGAKENRHRWALLKNHHIKMLSVNGTTFSLGQP